MKTRGTIVEKFTTQKRYSLVNIKQPTQMLKRWRNKKKPITLRKLSVGQRGNKLRRGCYVIKLACVRVWRDWSHAYERARLIRLASDRRSGSERAPAARDRGAMRAPPSASSRRDAATGDRLSVFAQRLPRTGCVNPFFSGRQGESCRWVGARGVTLETPFSVTYTPGTARRHALVEKREGDRAALQRHVF